LPGLVLTLVVGAGVFVLSRFLGYLVVERMLGRVRIHARWSHFATFLFLTAAGVSYALNTKWLVGTDVWIRRAWDWFGTLW
jgi:hypothetical protein